MFAIAARLQKIIMDLLFPPHCIVCEQTGVWLCDGCGSTIKSHHEWLCIVCDQNTAPFAICSQCRSTASLDGIFIVSKLEGVLKTAIHKFKYDHLEVLAQPLARVLERELSRDEHFQQMISGDQVRLLIPVPLHPNRLKERGFNQSQLLAKKLSEYIPALVMDTSLTRTIDTPKQMELGKQERLQNVNDAFKYTGGSVENNVVFLLDDVCTSGATLVACAEELKRKGAIQIWGIVLAHGN